MKALFQRVTRASVEVGGEKVAEIGAGLVILLCAVRGDETSDAHRLAKKCCELRIFEDAEEKMNRSVAEIGGRILAVSQFTLAADCRRGCRPSFENAAPPEEARLLCEEFCRACRAEGLPVEEGVFAAHMKLSLLNDGPVTILLDSSERRGES